MITLAADSLLIDKRGLDSLFSLRQPPRKKRIIIDALRGLTTDHLSSSVRQEISQKHQHFRSAIGVVVVTHSRIINNLCIRVTQASDGCRLIIVASCDRFVRRQLKKIDMGGRLPCAAQPQQPLASFAAAAAVSVFLRQQRVSTHAHGDVRWLSIMSSFRRPTAYTPSVLF